MSAGAPSGPDAGRIGMVIVATGVVIALLWFFREILSPLVVATFLLLLIEALAAWVHRLMPRAPAWARRGLAGAIILVVFLVLALGLALQAPVFASQIQALGPRIDDLILLYGAQVGLKATSLGQLLRVTDLWRLVGAVFATLRGVVSYLVLVLIYLGFLIASRAAFGRKLQSLYAAPGRAEAVRRVTGRVRHAAQTYAKLQTLKALVTAAAAFLVLTVLGVHEALFIAFPVFLAVYVPIVGPAVGVALPTLIAFAQFGSLGPAAIVFAVLEATVFINGNVVMPKLQSSSLNIDPLLVLLSLGFWGLIFGAPGVVLSPPLTFAVMTICAEFRATRWLAVLISADGHPEGATAA